MIAKRSTPNMSLDVRGELSSQGLCALGAPASGSIIKPPNIVDMVRLFAGPGEVLTCEVTHADVSITLLHMDLFLKQLEDRDDREKTPVSSDLHDSTKLRMDLETQVETVRTMSKQCAL